MNWQKGDLALCVKGGVIDPSAVSPSGWPLSGRVYRVAGAGAFRFSLGVMPALWLADGPNNNSGDSVWAAMRFVKVTPGTEIEGVEAENRIKEPAW